MSKQKRAAVYTRVSTDEQAKHGLSLGVQEATCRAAAVADGCTVTDADVFVDDGYSGRSTKRPAYKQLLSRLDEYDVVYAIRLDRYSRSVRDVFALLDECSKHETLIKAVHSKIDLSSAMGRAMVGVSAVFAALESELAQERVLEVKADAAEQGRTISKPPFGYMLPAPKAVIIPAPQTAHVVQSIFRDYANGKPVMTICQELNAAQVPKRNSGSDWAPNNIRYILGCQTYIGKVRHKQNVYVGRHEAIIDDGTWAKCQLRIASNSRVHPPARSGSLSASIRCGYCGHNLHAGRSGRGVRFYQCNANRFNSQKHPPVFIRDRMIEGYIWLLVEEILSGDGENFYKQSLSLSVQGDGRLDVLKNERRQLEDQIKYHVTASSEAGLAIHLLADLLRPLQARLADVEAEIVEVMDGPAGEAEELLMMQGLAELKLADYESKRRFLGVLFRDIEVFNDRIVFHPTIDGRKPLAILRQKCIGYNDKKLELRVI